LKREVLARFKSWQCFAIVRREVKRVNVVTFENFAGDAKFAVTVPQQFDVFGFFGFEGGRFDEQLQTLPRQALLLALIEHTPDGREENEQHLRSERGDDEEPDTNAHIAGKGGLQLCDKGLH
jgi:hypothetical protein